MNSVKFKGSDCSLEGAFPQKGQSAPAFELTTSTLETISSSSFKGKNILLNIFPSLDTAVCAMSVRRFNTEASKQKDTAVVCVSIDLPFAMGRFCTTEGIENVVAASAFRNAEFGKEFGVMLTSGPLRGLLTRAVVLIDKTGKIAYSQLVEEITQEPDYDTAIGMLSQL